MLPWVLLLAVFVKLRVAAAILLLGEDLACEEEDS
jgi:hypothetical protein